LEYFSTIKKNNASTTTKKADIVDTEIEFIVSSVKLLKLIESMLEKTLSIINKKGKKKPSKNGIMQIEIPYIFFWPLKIDNFCEDEFVL
tara:strand:+ start:1564 stop:1830 length:267 start_codon:yes stop_codon:yes gene_type:complete